MIEPVSTGENVRDRINLEYNVHKHLDRMSSLITNPSLNEDRYNWAIEHLIQLLQTYADDEFTKNVDAIRDHFDGKIVKHKTKDDDFSTILEIRGNGTIDKNTTTQGKAELIKQRNRLIFKELNGLIKRLNMGLEQRGYEDINVGGFDDECDSEENTPTDIQP